MNRQVLWQLSVICSPEREEAVSELIASRLGVPFSSYTDLETGKTTVSVYLQTRPDWSKSSQEQLRQALGRVLRSNRDSGALPRRRYLMTLTKLRPENWAEAWKRHFKPLHIGTKLLIRPSWSPRRPKPRQSEVVLDPGLSFGTGQHPTTSFCLIELARQRSSGLQQSFLDIGTGSGILAISASKLGFQPVHAFDLDPQAIAIARANARRNRVSQHIQFKRQDLAKLSAHSRRSYSVICANLLSDVLKEHSQRILSRLETGGLLVVAGILKREFKDVQRIYESHGLRLVRSRTEREWRSASLIREF